MLKKVSSTALWLVIFLMIVAVQLIRRLARGWKAGSVGAISYHDRVTGSIKP